MAGSTSKRSEVSLDAEGKRSTKGTETERRFSNLDNDFIITTRVEKGLKRWKSLQTVISKKQEKVAKGARSKWLEHYKKERDELVEQMQVDFPELQSIFYDEYSNAFDRMDKRRTTTGDMRKENHETLSFRSAESEIRQLKRQPENERKSREEALLILLRLRSAESEINQLKKQLENERKSKEEALLSLRSPESEINQWMSQLENEWKSNEEVLIQMRSQICREKIFECLFRFRLNRRLDESENEKVALKLNHEEEIRVHKEEIRKLQERLTIDKSYEERAKELNTKCDELVTALARSEKKLKEEIKTAKNRYNILEDEKRKTVEELKRQLRDNNPNTVELSDPNRPTKLSEQFSELYDKEWTDAFDELGKLLDDKEEKQIIFYLRDFVLEIHSVCSDLSFSKMKTIEEAFVKPSVPSENTKLPIKILTTIKDGIKFMAPNLLEYTREKMACKTYKFPFTRVIENDFILEIQLVLGRLEEKYLMDPVAGCLHHQNVKRYIDRCTEVCWYMSVQDPQLVMDGSKSPDDKFDSSKYREYTKNGPYEEFVVWPVLYLYRGGQMLSKGVAQGAKKEMIGQQ